MIWIVLVVALVWGAPVLFDLYSTKKLPCPTRAEPAKAK
jgi:hypothetical protein